MLRWWVAKQTLTRRPTPKQVSTWDHFAAQNFIYRGAWGLGSVLGVLLDLEDGGRPIAAMEADDWPRSGLPWIAFWLKELLTWGTLEPVAAYLLARGDAVDRVQAEHEAVADDAQLPEGLGDNERLDPRRVRQWLNERVGGRRPHTAPATLSIDVALTREQGELRARRPVGHARRDRARARLDRFGGILRSPPANYRTRGRRIPMSSVSPLTLPRPGLAAVLYQAYR